MRAAPGPLRRFVRSGCVNVARHAMGLLRRERATPSSRFIARGIVLLRVAIVLLLVLVPPAANVGCHPPTPSARAPASIETAGAARAAVTLCESAPVETTLDHADIPDADATWVAMIERARRTIDFAEFYASESEPEHRNTSKLTPVIDAIARASSRGVRVRFLADSVFAGKYPNTLSTLSSAGAAVRIVDFGKRGGGVMHAKYFVVDDSDAFVGSQNFDWRALEHIQEIGARVQSTVFARALLDVYEMDWAFASAPTSTRAPPHGVRRANAVDLLAQDGATIEFVASPRGWLPDESRWDLPKIVGLIRRAARTVDVQLLTYTTKDRDGHDFTALDDALRRAAARGVHVRILVSDWATKPGSEARGALERLTTTPNVEVRVLTIPRWSRGDVPFARVAHAKYMIIDARERHAASWIGTSNWEGDYFTKSRNVGVIVAGGTLPSRLDRVFEDGWVSSYAAPLAAIRARSTDDAGGAPPSNSDPERP